MKPQISAHAPDVRGYLQFREYLSDYFSWRQSEAAGFSFQKWADELGVKSRSFLRMVLIGQRSLSESMLPIFVQGLKLSDPQARYFETLVRFNQAKQHSQRENLGNELIKLVKGHRRSEVQNHMAYLSSHLTPRLHTLLALEDIDRSAENLALLLNTSPRKVDELLEVLRSLKLAEPFNDREWKATSELFHVPTELGHTALLTYYKLNLEEALQALDRPPENRRFGTLLINLDPEQFLEVQKEVMGFFDQLLAKYDNKKGAGTQLFQLNQNLIAVTPVLKEKLEPLTTTVEETSSGAST